MPRFGGDPVHVAACPGRARGEQLGRVVLRDIALVCLAVLAVALSYGAIAVTSGTWPGSRSS
ncbi:hypothetical protein ACQP1K_13045 [Sphaerimonospora sp. CA-214678]|uniref:hypothetical protein n=1 Tax=Sphaerimonospora sp. CA-214678 TaxID=3240029 RepID=UPI003D8D27F2